jgi:hypothetical protein
MSSERTGQGFALDPQKGGALLKPNCYEVQGLGPWQVWVEPNLAFGLA